MVREEKKERVARIKDWFEDTDSVILINYRGVTVHDANVFRGELKSNGAVLRVLKNTMTRIALTGTEKEKLMDYFEGPMAAVFIEGDPLVAARLVSDFAKGKEGVKVRGGILEQRMVTGEQIRSLSRLPSRERLIAILVGGIASPLTGLVTVLTGVARSLVTVLRAIADRKPPEVETETVVSSEEERVEETEEAGGPLEEEPAGEGEEEQTEAGEEGESEGGEGATPGEGEQQTDENTGDATNGGGEEDRKESEGDVTGEEPEGENGAGAEE